MILCDFCTEPITDVAFTFSTQTAIERGSNTIRLDFHQECMAAFAQQASSIKGKRPPNPGGTKP